MEMKLSNALPDITDFGELSYATIRDILMRIDSASQLRAIEEASPHLELDDGECWIRLINRHFPVLHTQHQFEPRNPASWHRVYAKYAKLNAEQKALAAEKLKNAFAGIRAKKDANTRGIQSFAQSNLPRPPRDTKPMVGVKRRPVSHDSGELRFTGGSRTKTNTGKSVMRKVKREVAEIKARNKLVTPGGKLVARQGQIKQAPQGMLHEQQVKNLPAFKIRPPVVKSRDDEERDRAQREREERLRKLKTPNHNANIIEDSDLDDEEDEDNEYDDYDGGGGGGGGALNVDDLEDMYDEPPEKSSSTKSDFRRPAALPGKRNSLAPSAHRASAVLVSARPVPKTSTQDLSKPKPRPTHAMSSSPPLGPSSPPKPANTISGPSGSPELKPKMPLKRKAVVDVFMKKPKVLRR